MFGFLRIANMLGPPKFQGAVNQKNVKRTPVGPFVVFSILFVFVLVVVLNLKNHAVPALATISIALLAALILGNLFYKGVKEQYEKNQIVKNMPEPRSAQLLSPESAALRTRASELRGGTAVLDRPLVTLPAPVRQPTNVRQIKKDHEEYTRLMRVAAIMVVGCPLCEAEEADLCRPLEGTTWYQLDEQRGIFAHAQRIGSAVKSHTADIEDITAQFNNEVPDEIWEHTLDEQDS